MSEWDLFGSEMVGSDLGALSLGILDQTNQATKPIQFYWATPFLLRLAGMWPCFFCSFYTN